MSTKITPETVLEKTAQSLRHDNGALFDMNTYIGRDRGSVEDCGTPRCLIGWLAFWSVPTEERLSLRELNWFLTTGHLPVYDDVLAALAAVKGVVARPHEVEVVAWAIHDEEEVGSTMGGPDNNEAERIAAWCDEARERLANAAA